MTIFVLDTTVLIEHLRGRDLLRQLVHLQSGGHVLATTAVNVAEIEQGLPPSQRKAAFDLVDRLRFLPTTKEAARRAGRYRADLRGKGRNLELLDALIAGTARAHGAVLVTDNVRDYPMRDIKVVPPEEL